MATVRRPCLDCPNLTEPGQTRCPACTRAHHRRLGSATRRGYDTTWQRHARAAITTYRRHHGDTCPGWGRDPHPIHPDQWVCDHDHGPMCRSCNGRKAATHDRARAAARAQARRRY